MLGSQKITSLYAAFVFATAAGLFLRAGLASYAWLLCYAITSIWIITHWQESRAIFIRVWVVFIPPFYYCLSAGWSLAPMATLTSGLQLLMTTIIAVRLAAALTPNQAMRIAAMVLLVLVGLSLANGMLGFFTPAWEHNGALLGMFTQKNAMGKVVVLAALMGITIFWQRKMRLTAVLLYLLLWPVVIMTKSAGAMLTYTALSGLFVLLALVHLSPLLKRQLLCFGLICVVLTILAYILTGGDPRTDLLTITGKSQTLTGRLDIWKMGLERWKEDWLFGIGHRSFWVYDTYAVRKIHATIEEELYWFHNIYIDILVAGGVIGATLCGLMIATLIKRALWWYNITTTPEASGWFMVLVISMMAGIADNVLFTPHDFNHMLIAMAYLFSQRLWIQQQIKHKNGPPIWMRTARI